jgi:hypothetical protein
VQRAPCRLRDSRANGCRAEHEGSPLDALPRHGDAIELEDRHADRHVTDRELDRIFKCNGLHVCSGLHEKAVRRRRDQRERLDVECEVSRSAPDLEPSAERHVRERHRRFGKSDDDFGHRARHRLTDTTSP